jgi:hypothetical protein
MSQQVVRVDSLRSLAAGSISGTYAPVGTSFQHNMRLVRFQNTTDAGITLSFDGVADNLYLPSQTFLLFDITTNRLGNLTTWCFQNGTQVYAAGSPSMGAVYVECLYGQGD